jgi:hypothetical protein
VRAMSKKEQFDTVKLDYDDLADILYVTIDHYKHETSGTFLPIEFRGIGKIKIKNMRIMVDLEKSRFLGIAILHYSKSKNNIIESIIPKVLLKSQDDVDECFERFVKIFALEVQKISMSIEKKGYKMVADNKATKTIEKRKAFDVLIREIKEIGEKVMRRDRELILAASH